jgi:ribose transport system substrate-binding protein
MNRGIRLTGLRVAIACLGLALGGQSAFADSSSGTPEVAPGSGTGMKVIYIAGDKSASYVAAACGMREVAKVAGADFQFQQAEDFSPARQIPIVDAAVAAKPNVILISPTDPQALIAPLQEAHDQGIKVILVGNTLNDNSFIASEVIADNVAAGRRVAQLLGDLAKTKHLSGPVALITYQRGGSGITDARQDGFEAEIKKYPTLSYVGPQISGISATDGAAVAQAVFAAHPDLVGVVTTFEPASEGVATVIREQNLQGKVIGLQMDSVEVGIEDIKNGALRGLTGENFRGEGRQAMAQAIAAVKGTSGQKTVYVDNVVFTPDNVASPEMQKYITKPSCD